MNKLVLWAVLGWSASAFADHAPLLEGTYEVWKLQQPGKPDQILNDGVATKKTSWNRMLFTYDGNKITMTSQMLHVDKDSGQYVGCQVSTTSAVTWTATSYTVTLATKADETITHFKQLTHKDTKTASEGCSTSIEAATWTVKPGDQPTISQGDQTVVLRATKLDPAWQTHIP